MIELRKRDLKDLILHYPKEVKMWKNMYKHEYRKLVKAINDNESFMSDLSMKNDPDFIQSCEDELQAAKDHKKHLLRYLRDTRKHWVQTCNLNDQ
jgi:hypothetical protein